MRFQITIEVDGTTLTAQECMANTLHAAKQIATQLCLEQQHITPDLRGGYQANWADTGDNDSQKVWTYNYRECAIRIREKKGVRP